LVAFKSIATFVSRLSLAPKNSGTLAAGQPRATLPLSFEGELAVCRFEDMETFAKLWAHALTDGALKLDMPLDRRRESPVGCTLLIGDDRFPAQRLKILDDTRAVIELLPSPALLTCIARHAREQHAGRPVQQPAGVSRKAARFETALDVQFADVPHLAERYATDISRGGMFVACTPQPEMNRQLPLRMTLPTGETLEVPVVVVQRITEGTEPGVGVQFVGSSEHVLLPIQALLKTYEKRRPRVLVIDDEAIWRSTITRILEPMGVEVVTARDGREGLNTLTDLLFDLDLVVLDLHMPYIDGRGLLERVRRHGNETGLRLFLFSAAGPDELRALGEESLANAIFSKLDPIDLLAKRLALELGRPTPDLR
jgi:CheY-like chemotaxis protein